MHKTIEKPTAFQSLNDQLARFGPEERTRYEKFLNLGYTPDFCVKMARSLKRNSMIERGLRN